MFKHRKSILTLLIGGYGDKFILFAQGILLVPIYLSNIGVEVYGYWLATGGVLAWLGAFDMRIGVVINQKIAALVGKGQEGEIAKTFFSGLSGFIFILLPVLPLALYLYSPLIDFLQLPLELHREFFYAYFFAAFGLVLSFITSALTALPKGLLQPTFPVVVHFLCGLVQIMAVVYLLHLGLGVLAIGLALFLRFSISTILNFYYSISIALQSKYSDRGYLPSLSILRQYVNILPPLVFSRFTSGLVSKIEPTIILKFTGPELAACYSITKSVAFVLSGLVNSVTGAVFPSFATVCGEADCQRVEDAFFRCMEFLSCALLMYFGGYALLNQAFIYLWVGESYFLGSQLTALIALALISVAVSNFLNSALTAKGDIVFASWLRGGEELTRIFLLVLGAYVLGVAGLPIAVVLSAISVIIVYCVRFCHQFGFSVFSFRRINSFLALLFILPSVFGFSLLGRVLQVDSWLAFFFSLVLVASAMLFICFLISDYFRRQIVDTLHFLTSKFFTNLS